MQANTEIEISGETVIEGEYEAMIVPCDNGELRTANESTGKQVGTTSTLSASEEIGRAHV